MTIPEFIKKAVEGGWKEKLGGKFNFVDHTGLVYFSHGRMNIAVNIEHVLLDPKAWEAVGKVEGWGNICSGCELKAFAQCHCEDECDDSECGNRPKHIPEYLYYQQKMIVQIQKGNSIEDYIKTL